MSSNKCMLTMDGGPRTMGKARVIEAAWRGDLAVFQWVYQMHSRGRPAGHRNALYDGISICKRPAKKSWHRYESLHSSIVQSLHPAPYRQTPFSLFFSFLRIPFFVLCFHLPFLSFSRIDVRCVAFSQVRVSDIRH